MADEQQPTANETEGQAGQQFALQRIYIKDLSFEAPMGVEAFSQQWKPQVNQEINAKNAKVGDDAYEVVLSLTVTVKLEDKVVFLIELQQAGVFFVKGLENEQLAQVLSTTCLQILFPYARETIDNVIVKGSFPALMLPPVNFDALYLQWLQQAKEKAGEAENKTVN
ncbi:protein-export chaperone SecB [Aurantivibrio plasticivorans]